MLVKAETQAAEVEGPYGTDGQTHSLLNPADLSLSVSLCLPLLTHILYPDSRWDYCLQRTTADSIILTYTHTCTQNCSKAVDLS